MRAGRIVRIVGSVVDVAFPADHVPPVGHLLTARHLALEVCAQLGDHRVRALAFDSTDGLGRGEPVHDTGGPIRVPVGPEVLGRALNALGEPVDELGPVPSTVRWPIHRPAAAGTRSDPLETGIKAIDLFAPLPRGGRVGIVGPTAGRNHLVLELIRQFGRAVYASVGQRAPEASALWAAMQQAGVLTPGDPARSSVVWVCAPMSEPASARARCAWTAATLAESLRDEGGRDVLLFLDDVPAFDQALGERATLLGHAPVVGGRPPSWVADRAAFEGRIGASTRGSITAIQILAESGPTELHLDAVVVLSRVQAELGLWPPVDPLASRSSVRDDERERVAQDARRTLLRYRELQEVIHRHGMDELCPEDRKVVARARKLQYFQTQPMFVTEAWTRVPGAFVGAEEAVRGFREIVRGDHDEQPEDAFILVGGIDAMSEKAARISRPAR